MKAIWLAIAMAAGGAQPQPAPSPRILTTTRVVPRVQCTDMNWLAGAWRTAEPASTSGASPVVEELWMPEAAGLMLGLGRTVGAGRRSFEYMRIERDRDGIIRFYGSPGGAPAVPFHLMVCERGVMTFENGDHDYPQVITYRREGDSLTASIAKLSGAER
jgi:Domain of unknown function (DUF6265)